MLSKNIYSKKWIKWGIIPLVLLLFWIGSTVWYTVLFDKSFLVLSYPHDKMNFTQFTDKKLFKGDVLSGKFQAKEDNLGIVSLRFTVFNRVPYKSEDHIAFRLKELGAKRWYYQNEYRSGLIYDVPLFPFGFPKIDNSQGKTYQFELESLNGNNLNAVSLNNREPVIFSTYQANKQELLHDKTQLGIFIMKKLINSLQTIDIIFVSFVFLLPFLFYLFLASPIGIYLTYRFNKSLEKALPFKKRLKGVFISYWHLLLLFILLIFISLDIFILQLSYGLVFIVIILLFVFVEQHSGKGNKCSYIAGGIFLLVTPLVLLFNKTHIAELTAAWGFLFFVAALVQSLLEVRKSH